MQTYSISELPLVIQEQSALVKKAKGDTIKMTLGTDIEMDIGMDIEMDLGLKINVPHGMDLVLKYFEDSTFDKDNIVQNFIDFCVAFKRLEFGECPNGKYNYKNIDRVLSTEQGNIFLDDVFCNLEYNKTNPKFSFDDYNGWIFDLVKDDMHLLYTFQKEIVDVLLWEEDFFPKHKEMVSSDIFSPTYMVDFIDSLDENFRFPKNIQYLIENGFYNKKDLYELVQVFYNDIGKDSIMTIKSSKYIFTQIIFDLINSENFEEEYLINAMEEVYNCNKEDRCKQAVLHLIDCYRQAAQKGDHLQVPEAAPLLDSAIN